MITDDYENVLSLTSQFRFCGNPFRLDFYTFCSFGCKYCFARTLNSKETFKKSYAKFEKVKKYFEKAFESNEETRNLTVELLRHKVPIHIGGMSDPFQPFEFEKKLNYQLIELSNKYQYPLIFSTKQCYLPDEYYEILDPALHSFQISLIGVDEDYIRKYEVNSPTATERINFLKTLRKKGFWCSIRIQPVIDMKQVIKLCDLIDGIASYVTIEHLKLNIENPEILKMFAEYKDKFVKTSKARNLEISTQEKIENIKLIKEHLPHTKIGVGDNDLHYLSESRCCCGIDTINKNFDNYLKYNLTYFTTEHLSNKKAIDEVYWLPISNVGSILNSTVKVKNVNSFKDYVDLYCGKYPNLMCDGCSMKNILSGTFFDKNGNKKKQTNIFDFIEEEK